MILQFRTPFVVGVPIYFLFFILGSALALAVSWWMVKKNEAFHDVRYFDILWLSWVAGIVGAKLTSIILDPGEYLRLIARGQWWRLFEGGYHVMGGVIAGTLCLFLLSLLWRHRVHVWGVVQIALIAVPVGLAVGRIGCLFAGCCFGRIVPEARALWAIVAVRYHAPNYGLQALGLRYALQIYEVIFMTIMALGAWLVFRRGRARVQAYDFLAVGGWLALFVTLWGVFRFLSDNLRDPLSRTDLPLGCCYFSQWVALCLACVGLIVGIIWVFRKFARSR